MNYNIVTMLPHPELQRNASPSVGASVTNGIPVASIKTGNRFCQALASTLQSEAVFSRCQQLSDAIKAESAVSAAKAADVLLGKLLSTHQ